jgi:creatinine amidohydrolase/Fe(II)-dependent formamide hydrolase-like protein
VKRDNEVRLENHTRREFREALAAGHFRAAIIATGSIEQHMEHMEFPQDITSSTYVAERAAGNLYPGVVVSVPMNIGISEHHMGFPGTMTARSESWLAVLFDAVESLVRHGIKRVLILNGHGGNVSPVLGVIHQWRQLLTANHGNPLSESVKAGVRTHSDYVSALLDRNDTGVDLRFNSYWDLIPVEFAHEVLDGSDYPGHAGEFETSFSLYAQPEVVRQEAIAHNDDDSSLATAEKGRLVADKAVEGVTAVVKEMLSG